MSRNDEGRRTRLLRWILVKGSRTALTGSILVLFFLTTLSLIRLEILTVGSRSSIPLLLGSGIISGLLTLITVTLSINQLILSRLFGSPTELNERLEGTIDIHDTVEEIADQSTSPNDLPAFLSLIADTLNDRSIDLQRGLNDCNYDISSDIHSYASEIEDYSSRIGNISESRMGVEIPALRNEHSEYIKETRRVRKEYAEEVTEEVGQILHTILSLLRSVAITHRYMETLFLHQELAQLSRLIAYSGFAAFIATIYLTLVYRFPPGGAVIPAQFLPMAVSTGLTIIISPLVVLVSHILRIATVARYTVAVGPFTPLEEFGE